MATSPKNLKHTALILIIGLSIAIPLLLFDAMAQDQATADAMNQTGVLAGYDPDAGYIYVNYTDRQNDTRNMEVKISVVDANGASVEVFDRYIDAFPAEITYIPDDRRSTYVVLVKLSKENGNYTYPRQITPAQQDRQWRLPTI